MSCKLFAPSSLWVCWFILKVWLSKPHPYTKKMFLYPTCWQNQLHIRIYQSWHCSFYTKIKFLIKGVSNFIFIVLYSPININFHDKQNLWYIQSFKNIIFFYGIIQEYLYKHKFMLLSQFRRKQSKRDGKKKSFF